MESPTRYSQLLQLLCVHLAIPDNICPEKNGRLNQMKKKKIVIGVTDTFGRVPGAQFYVPL